MIDDMESITAKLCSFARAFHSNREREKIFDDYLSYDLMGREEYEEIGQLIAADYHAGQYRPSGSFDQEKVRNAIQEYIGPIPLSRAAFAERELWRFSYDCGECQYVICGAGMDTFAFRNQNPNIRVFEIDHPDTQRYKLDRIRKLQWNIPENVHFVSVDFGKDDMAAELKRAGFDPNRPSFFAILGVTYYLTLPVFEETLERISRISKDGSKLVFDYPDDTTFLSDVAERVKILSAITEKLGEPMQHGYAVSEINQALERHGFLVDEHDTPAKIQKRFFDGRSDRQRAFENIHFILAKKASRFNESYYLNI